MAVKVSQIAKIYAQSLYELSLDNKLIKSELKEILDTFTDELFKFFGNPTINLEAKVEMLGEIFKDKINQELFDFLKLLTEKDRIVLLPEIYEGFIERLNDEENILSVEVTSAIELNNNLKKRISDKLSEKLQKQIEPQWTISEDIIAGLVIKIGDDVIDTSIKNKLDNLSKYIRS